MTTAVAVKRMGAPLPREHGAWAMFLVPVLVAIGAARALNSAVLLFAITAFGFFLLRYPLALAIKSRAPGPRIAAIKWSLVYGGLTGIAGLLLLAAAPSIPLLVLGLLAILSLGIYLWHASRRTEMSMSGELIGIAGLVLGSPGAYFVATGQMNESAIALYVLNLIYFVGTVFYVKFRVREQPRLTRPEDKLAWRLWVGRTMLVYHLLALAVVVGMAAVGLAPSLAILAFVPMLCKAVGGVIAVPQHRLDLRRMGFLELGLAAFYASFLVLAFV